MKVAFRTDASLQIGSGHVMRCLTLADALRAQGVQCHFISRAHSGDLVTVIRQRGYMVSSLMAPAQKAQAAIKIDESWSRNSATQSANIAWLGCDWQNDAAQTGEILASLQPDWLVIDHYALDHLWEETLSGNYRQLLVIDDLADRPHNCDLLLDQNLGRRSQDYANLVPANCKLLTGPVFALLRPEFAELRSYSLQRRKTKPALRRLLITMGGVDQPNATGQVLQTLKACTFTPTFHITVIMGLTAPWLDNVREQATQMPCHTEVVVNVNDMAQRMADSDLAIGAAGGTSWERCCLGVPAIVVVLAKNQQSGAEALQAANAVRLIGDAGDIEAQLPLVLAELTDPGRLSQMSRAASAITEGNGVNKIVNAMEMFNV